MQPKPLARWTRHEQQLVMDTITATLDGVGDVERVDIEVGDVALHVRRPLTASEAVGVPRRASEPVFPIERARR